MVATGVSERERALFRRMRPPMLRAAPDEVYEQIVGHASRIVRSDYYIRRTESSIRRARRGIEEGVWPAVMQARWDDERLRYADPVPTFDEGDTVTLLWLMEGVAGRAGLVHLQALRATAMAFYEETPRAASVPWNAVFSWGMTGALRSEHVAGLVYRAAPVTWALTALGREVLGVVFGDDE